MAETPWVNKSGGIFGVGSGDYGTYGYQTMVASGAIAGLGDILAGQAQSNALGVQADFNKFQATENMKRAKMETGELNLQTQTQLEQSGSKANQIIGMQKAAYSAQGVNVSSGSAQVEKETEGKMSAIDSAAILNNAALKAWGIETGAVQTAGQQNLEALGEKAEGQQSVTLGGAKALNQLFAMQEESERTKMMSGSR